MRKILFSRCPNCKKHGIRLFKTFRIRFGGIKPIGLKCNNCGESFKLSVITKVFAISVYVLFLLLMGIVFNYLSDAIMVKIIMCILFIILILVVEYFLPLKNV